MTARPAPGWSRPLRWAVLIAATLVVVGVFVQVYLIGAYVRGAGEDALDAHRWAGNAVQGLQALVLLAALAGMWRRWADIGLAIALLAVGTVQIGLAEGEEWVGGLHAFLALVVLVLATVIAHRAVRALGLGRHREGPAA